ncbi:MAG: hypothetical protein LUQ16_08340 [Methanomassiliicoccales archaeon]|nr:hypothetical protein [Methanomassiliicoccales archaeon]MDD1755927.1 hypothetical protein [Methanomassiliicoccales archaeon]
MSSFLTAARVAVLASLASVEIASLALAATMETMLPLAAAQTIFLVLAGFLLWRDRWDWFTIAAGLGVLVGVIALALDPDGGFVWPWAMLWLGMTAIMTGNHTCRSAYVLSASGAPGDAMESDFRRTAIRGYLRILVFTGLVWLVSLFVLLISLNAAIGDIPFWLMAFLALLAMVALTFLALAKRSAG